MPLDKPARTTQGVETAPWKRRVYFALGLVMVALGAIGAVLPVMPTTIFLIAAAACFGRASPRWEAYLLTHPRYGPALRAWREEGAISRRGKYWAVFGMTMGMILFWLGQPVPWLGAAATLFVAAAGTWVASRPEPGRGKPR